MPRLTVFTQLTRSVEKLRTERQALADRLAEIDALFAKVGIAPTLSGIPRPSARPSDASRAEAAPKRRPKRGRFVQTADQFVFALLSGKKLMTSEINREWEKAGRGGRANLTLWRLVTSGQIKRTKVKGEQGSSYTVV